MASPALTGMRGASLAGRKVNVAARAVAPARATTLKVEAKSYKVQQGDSVYAISTKFGVSPEEILAANSADFAGGETTIFPDQVIVIPGGSSGTGILGQIFSVKGAFVVALVLAAVFYRTNDTKEE